MTAPAIKLEQKRLHRSDQMGVDQTKSWSDTAPEARSYPQVMRQTPVLRHSVSKKLDLGTKQRQVAGEGILLGECRLNA